MLGNQSSWSSLAGIVSIASILLTHFQKKLSEKALDEKIAKAVAEELAKQNKR